MMLATRTAPIRRSAVSGAGRLVAHAVLAITLVVSVVFAHGGACAAVELSEPIAHSTHLADGGLAAAEQGARCLHRELPAGHQHGTEQDCSAIKPTGTPIPVIELAALSVNCPHLAAETSSALADTCRLTAPCWENLCVMRI
ncbi:hypothetical protein [Nonomuraea sp. LPB2021202275-12-8]|uniref:hypothetical protein n=1 Tax=Nonomuraea sp. LPB2021202275-12-8 TaxID=3120159 RepID=UPI00300C345E